MKNNQRKFVYILIGCTKISNQSEFLKPASINATIIHYCLFRHGKRTLKHNLTVFISASFSLFCFFNAVDTIHKRLAHNWFRTADLWCVGSDNSTYLLTVSTIALYRMLVCKRLCTFYQQWTFDYLLPILNGCIPTTYLHWTFEYHYLY